MRLYIFLVFMVWGFSVQAQVEKNIRVPARDLGKPGNAPDTLQAPPNKPLDSLKLPKDTLNNKAYKSDIETTINYSATDSIVSSLVTKKVWLYGDAKIKYGDIELEADEILIDYENSTLTANGTRDSLGNRIGFPIFKNGSEVYETKDIVYNFKTRRAKISEVVTKQGEGIIHGATVFKNEKNELFTRGNLYTTCGLEHPHFAIRSTKVKAIPKDKVVSGPFYMEFNGVPTPLGFAFGMFPAERESKSGIIFPSYGEERRRGFNLRQGGYFFDINEYIKVTLLADIYSKGGHAIQASTAYNKRYAYTGSFRFSYSKTPTSDRIESKVFQRDYQLSWSHSPQSKGTGRFSASVNAATSSFNTNNNLFNQNFDPNGNAFNNTTRRMNSNIAYSKTFKGTPFSLGLNATHQQDLRTKLVDLLLPSVSVNMNNIYPFQKKEGGKAGLLENINFRYTMTAQNKVNNRVSPDSIAPFTAQTFSTFLNRGNRGMKHNIPISTSMKVLKYFTLAPTATIDEIWYGERLAWGFDDENTIVRVDTVKGFNRITTYSAGIGLNTRIYGTVNLNKGKIQAIRHVMNPSVSYSYRPDFSTNENYFKKLVNPETGVTTFKSLHEGFMYGGANLGENQSINFGINNNFEMKVKDKDDTVARKVTLLNQLSFNSGYNFLADSFKLSSVSISANTTLFKEKLSINANATYDPYRILNGKRVDAFAWNHGGRGRITSANIALGTNLNPAGQKSDTERTNKINNSNLSESDKQHMINNPYEYVDFSIPWNLRISYSLNYFNNLGAPDKVTQALQFSGDIKLSEQWKVVFNSGYDFEAGEFTQTNLDIARDMHCWTMSLNWTPFGFFTSYNFRISVKSSMLQDLKMERRKPWLDNLR
ncbi:MAG: putative LPS assembly protein LptD [Chryseotalea sp.]